MTRLCAECAQAGGQHSASKANAACDRFVHGAHVHIPFSRVLQLMASITERSRREDAVPGMLGTRTPFPGPAIP
jgi:hypothetical protein